MRVHRIDNNRSHPSALAAWLLLLILLSGSIVACQTQNTSKNTATSGILWGMWIKDADGNPDPNPIIANREASLGHRLDVFHWYESWDSSWSNVGTLVEKISSTGRVPMITWEAQNRSVKRIAQGGYDAYIDSWATGAASNKPQEIWIRIFHEFNDPPTNGGYPWSIDANSPADLIAAWRHVHDRFAAAGADNVKWVWNPDGVNQDKIQPGYPGDRYVDYTGWDTYGYNNAKDYQVLAAISKKPMVIGEFGPERSQDSGLRGFTNEIASGAYPLVRAVVYFDEGKYSLARNPSARHALKQMLASAAFKR